MGSDDFRRFVKKINMRFLLRVFFSAIAVMLTSYLLPGIHVDNFLTSILVAVVLALLNAVVRPVLLFLSIPATILTMGLFIFVVNALIVMLASEIVPGFGVEGFWWALLFSVIVALISSILNNLIKKDEPPKQIGN